MTEARCPTCGYRTGAGTKALMAHRACDPGYLERWKAEAQAKMDACSHPLPARTNLPYALFCDPKRGGCGRALSADFSHQYPPADYSGTEGETDLLDPDGSRHAQLRRWQEEIG